MNHIPYRLTTLPNGVRIATANMPHMRSVAVGFWAAVGGRHESVRQGGIAHFLEHLLFKGTQRRNARQITEDVEGLGGYLNAFTTEDHTCYYAKAAAEHLPKLCDVLADMYVESAFPAVEIERERDVIREEILMYRDQPAQHAQELLTETMWPGHPLGRPLTGTIESVARLQRDEMVDFRGSHYCGRNTVVTVAGAVEHEEVVAILEPLLAGLPKGRAPRFVRARTQEGQSARVQLYSHETEQTHLALGFHAFGRRDERRFALKLLSVILGENMSSRLFQKLRERHGYCYSIQSSTVTLDDAGAFSVYAGIDPAKLERAVRMILRELEIICHRAPKLSELQKAKDYTIGQTCMGLESTSNQMMWMGESIIGYGKILDPQEVEVSLGRVTPAEIQRCACHCLNHSRLGVAVVGPVHDAEQIRGWLG
ncbi:MAG: pitrilysin family protein [Chthoniobacteraceae bacterium]